MNFFDSYFYGLCLIECNEIGKAEGIFIDLVKNGYPYETIIEFQKIFTELENDEKSDLLREKYLAGLDEENLQHFEQITALAKLDSKVRSECATPDCKEWRTVTDQNIRVVAKLLEDNLEFCINDIGYASVSLNLILLHGKTIEQFELLDELLKMQLEKGCMSPEHYSYWYDGYMTEIFERDEIFGTLSLLMYKNTKELPNRAEVLRFEENREKIGLMSFQQEVEMIDRR